MSDDIIIGVDLAKNVFQLHGARRDGHLLFRKKLSRSQFAKFCKEHPRCLIAMEACATAHYWARELEKLGHVVRLIPPIYVKPFVKRNKNDAAEKRTARALLPSVCARSCCIFEQIGSTCGFVQSDGRVARIIVNKLFKSGALSPSFARKSVKSPSRPLLYIPAGNTA